MDFDKLKTIDDWEALNINTNPVSSKDYTIYDLLKMRDTLRGLHDTAEYSREPDSDYMRTLWLLDGIHNALSSRTQNTGLWKGDKNLNPWTSKAEEYEELHADDPAIDPETQSVTTAKNLGISDDHFGEEQAAGLAEILKGLNEGPNDNRW